MRGHGGVVQRGDLRVHRCADVLGYELAVQRGIPVTAVGRTLLDLSAVVPAHHLRRAVERAELAELFDLTEVERTLADHPRRPGSRQLQILLDDLRREGVPQTRSDLEALVLTRRAFERDRARDRSLLTEGWRVARFTDRQIVADPRRVVTEIAALLAPEQGSSPRPRTP